MLHQIESTVGAEYARQYNPSCSDEKQLAFVTHDFRLVAVKCV
jgi:hypothetical protein